MEEVEILMGNYKFTQKYCIGQGSFGKVYKGNNILTGRQVAIKEMDGSLITQKEIASQIMILKQLRHPNIVEYEDAFQNNGYFYIVTEYCRGGDLRNVFQDSDIQQNDAQKQKKIVQVVKQVCKGFQYLKLNNIIHRDLKPSNILQHNGYYKIADFGLAKRQSVHKSVVNNDLVGVPIYMAPQILSKNYYTYKCDVWSLGIIIFQLFFQHLPWKSQDVDGLFLQIMNNPQPYLQKNKNSIPKIILFLLKNTLQYLEKDRLSWTDLLQAVQNISSLSEVKKNKQPKIYDLFSCPLTVNSSVPLHQAQVLHHLFSQAKSIQTELLSLSNAQYFKTLLKNILSYLNEGSKLKPLLYDCFFMFLKTCGNNLHLFMINYETLQDIRPLLIFLQLMHDYIFAAKQGTSQQFRKKISQSDRNKPIGEYAASVFSKINTFSMNREDEE